MSMQIRNIIGLTLASAAALSLAPAAIAQTTAKATMEAAKAAGLVGEQADGFLGFVIPTADPAIKAAVAEINAGRAQLYREAAARNNVTPEAAGAAAYKTVVEARLKPGEFYKPADGGWVRK
jgi:uncharacterized protein YdbL (DUF1318 family)